MLQLDPTIVKDRLAEIGAFKTIGLSADLGRVSARSLQYPSAFVILLGEQAGDNRYMSEDMVEQAVTARIGVVMAVRDIADTSGARASTSLAPLREAVLLSLCRFVPEAGGNAFRFAKGALQSGIDTHGGLFWQDDYTLRFDRRIQIT